ncbi:transglycosylase domain-containing protein [Candidatus Microgenomates bacterium]|nr:transglycosylase domain-containing protein [Candidatus Microgenomates bacterium]
MVLTVWIRRFKRIWNDPPRRMRLLKLITGGVFACVIGLFLFTTIVFAVFSINLPDPTKVIRRDGFSTVFFDRNGKTLYDLYNGQNRIPLELSGMPKYLQQATVAVEDKEFYKHQGFSLTGIARSFLNIITLQGIRGGGSTLTQQLVKNVLLTPEQSLVRKIKEVILANQIEKKFSKDQILPPKSK